MFEVLASFDLVA